METVLFLLFVLTVICGILGGVIGSRRETPGLGFAVGFFCGPLGVLIACFLPRSRIPGGGATGSQAEADFAETWLDRT